MIQEEGQERPSWPDGSELLREGSRIFVPIKYEKTILRDDIGESPDMVGAAC